MAFRRTYTFITQSREVSRRPVGRFPLASPGLHAIRTRRGIIDNGRICDLDDCCHSADSSECKDAEPGIRLSLVSMIRKYRREHCRVHTALMNTDPHVRELSTTREIEPPISVFRPRASKCEGHIGSHQAFVACWEL